MASIEFVMVNLYEVNYLQVYANQRKKLYHNRHKKNSDVKYSKQWLALNLLW